MTEPNAIPESERFPAPAKSAAAAAAGAEDVQARVERVLRTLPESRIETRRTITRDLDFDPTPEELNAVARLAREAPAGAAGEMSQGALELRVRAERKLSMVLDKPLHGPGIQAAARSVAELHREVVLFDAAMQAAIGALGNIEGRFLREIGETLMPSSDALVTASVLAPRLSLFTETNDANDLRSAVPSLTEDEAVRIAALLHGCEELGNGASRASINALALQTILLDDLAAWDGLQEGDAIESRESVGRRLQQDKTAYLVLAQQLQKRQDLALLAGLQDLARELRDAKKDLFAVYTRLAAVLNGAADPESGREEDPHALDGAGSVERLLADCRAADAIAEAQRSVRQSTEELFLDALKRDSGQGPVAKKPRRRRGNLQRERMRMRFLATIAGILVVGCVGVYGSRIGRTSSNSLSIPATELNGPLVVSQALGIGSMMVAETSRFVWDDLADQERITHVESLGVQARAKGFDTVCLTDENRVELALWDAADGVTIHARR